MTVLFADLVGFTRLCEQTDPEDVDRLLREYYALARSAIEAYGGVVEKYIGDAVAGVFGIPKAHEDDPERAVRAGLLLIDRLDELSVGDARPQARVGVNTGAVLARLDVDPASGQGFLVGDAVNTAARLQVAAPPMRVVVGELTHELSSRTIEYEAMDEIAAKGKAEPLRPWLVKAPLARRGIDLTRVFSTPFVGREVELGILRGLFEKAVASCSPQFALISGEAGIGKSRLVFELARHLERSPDVLATWRQGRTLPYRAGAAFSALSEIVRAHCGILESDDEDAVEAKLSRVLPNTDEAGWVKARLRPLLGIESSPALQEENFSAWLRFLEGLARSRPLVVVFEDLHWAREGTLAFLAHLADRLIDVPVLLIATARPELHDAHPGFARDERWVALELRSLSRQETARLVDHLAGSAAADVEHVVAERCGGNPFFTEELVRLLQERSFLDGTPASRAENGGSTALPDSLRALLAARLDALDPALKAVLADAAVVGQTFWPGVLAIMGGNDTVTIDGALQELSRREFVRPLRTSLLEGEEEFAFWHGLTREVAYGQLPRARRAAKHQVVAQWIEERAGGRLADTADVLAYHYETAYDLAHATGELELAGRLREPTVRFLRLAGDRALPLDVPMAERHYRHALDHVPEDDDGRAALLTSWAEALIQSGRLPEAIQALEAAVDGLQAAGDRCSAAVVMTRLRKALFWHDDRRAAEVCTQALALLENDQPSVELIRVLEERASQLSEEYAISASLEVAERALRIASELGLAEPHRALDCRGMSRIDLGDERGLDDLRRALLLAIERADSMEAGADFYDLADAVCVFEGPRAAAEVQHRGLEFSEKRGNRLVTTWLRVQTVQHALWTGEWESALVLAEELEGLLADADDPLNLLELRWAEARLLTLRGEPDKAEPLALWGAERGRSQPGNALNCLPSLAVVQLALGDRDAALATVAEAQEMSLGIRGVIPYAMALSTLIRTAVQAGDPDLAARLLVGVPARRALDSHTIAAADALLAEARGEREGAADAYARAARRWHDFGVPYEEAQARLGSGRCLVALGRAPEAAPPLAEARVIFERLGARPALQETERLVSALVNLPA